MVLRTPPPPPRYTVDCEVLTVSFVGGKQRHAGPPLAGELVVHGPPSQAGREGFGLSSRPAVVAKCGANGGEPEAGSGSAGGPYVVRVT